MSSLAQLVLRAQQGEAAAFDLLARETFPLAHRWALVQTGSADDAQDVAQQAMLVAWLRIREFRRDSRFSTWLYTIVRRTAADWRRSERRRSAREAVYAQDVPRAVETRIDPDVSRPLASVLRLLRRLPARQREVFDLLELQGLTMDEVIALTGLQPSTVRVHLLRARRAIRTGMLSETTRAEVME